MSRPTAKRPIKKQSSNQRRPGATTGPDAPLDDAELDRVVGGRQTPRTDFGSVLGRGISKAADVATDK